MNIGFVGLGVMGYPMAGHLQTAGHEVTVFNRNPDRAACWEAQYGGAVAATPRQAAAGAELACCCVGNDDDVRSVVLGDQGILEGLASGAVLVDHTTASAGLANELALAASERQLGFLDAPVSGGQAGAENGVLTIMVGGKSEVFESVAPVLRSYARCIRLLGPTGSGQLAKMVNQICIAGIIQGLAEAMQFSEQAGLNTAAVMEVISQGAAQSWQMENRAETMLAGEYQHGFAVDWMRKDISMVLAEANTMGMTLPVTELVHAFYGEVQDMGGGRWDTSSLLARLQKINS
ncbi:MAG: NAD(P)-dependent oxidoreductase [Halieaceae bacterium]|jgi:3-hydroxyisobutyrate dehydrogenase-like beta-hydroxyacid dehydrogenase|nr:NAD(P)-dependent oxidoreductase [Halieaceae bacterium]